LYENFLPKVGMDEIFGMRLSFLALLFFIVFPFCYDFIAYPPVDKKALVIKVLYYIESLLFFCSGRENYFVAFPVAGFVVTNNYT